MPISSFQPPCAGQISSVQLVLREAKRLHRAAASGPLSEALPILRRLMATRAVTDRSLPGLFRARCTVQRKHVLRALAREAGYASWEDYRHALPHLDISQLEQLASVQRGTAVLKLWFSDTSAARRFAAEQGGQAVRVGVQAVVLPAAPSEAAEAGQPPSPIQSPGA
ncbi:MAG: hypothetical protein JNM92_09270 [Zoogloea sp.]|nr:hypothetical protein [Zoogloea sp.]